MVFSHRSEPSACRPPMRTVLFHPSFKNLYPELYLHIWTTRPLWPLNALEESPCGVRSVDKKDSGKTHCCRVSEMSFFFHCSEPTKWNSIHSPGILCMLQIQYNAVSAQINHLRMWFVSLESKWLIITITSLSLFTFKFSKYINEAWSRQSIGEIKGFNLRCRTSVLTQTLLTCLWGQRLWQTSSCCSLVPILKPTPSLYGCSSLLPWQTNLWSLPTPV